MHDVRIVLDRSCHYGSVSMRIARNRGRRVTIDGNGATLTGGRGDAVLRVDGADVEVANVRFARGGAGAIENDGGHVVVTNATFDDNAGGAIENASREGKGGFVRLAGSSFSGNHALDGGAVLSDEGRVVIVDSTFAANDATAGDGGAILVDAGELYVKNSTFSRNTADGRGGAIAIEGASTTIISTTMWANRSATSDGISGSAKIANSIIAGSAGGSCGRGESLRALPAAGPLSNFSDSSSCSNAFHVVPDVKLDPALRDNGGSTQTHALLPGSPALDAGSNRLCPSSDQRGSPRPADLRDPCDAGAYEGAQEPVLNAAPTAANRSLLVRMNHRARLDLTSLSSDAETADAELAFSLAGSDPARGRASLSGSVLTYEPNRGESGVDVVTYRVSDTGNPPGCGDARLTCADRRSALGTIAVTIVPRDAKNTPPRASDGFAAVTSDSTSAQVDLTSITRDAETPSAHLEYALTGQAPAQGTTTLSGSVITYQVSAGATGTDSFTYRVTDGGYPDGCSVAATGCARPLSATGTITVTIETPETAGPDLTIQDVRLELVPGGSAIGAAKSYAVGRSAAIIFVAPAALHIQARLYNQGDMPSEPTSLSVATSSWKGDAVPVPEIEPGQVAEIEGSISPPPQLADSTRFTVTVGSVEGETDSTNNARPNVLAVRKTTSVSKTLVVVIVLVLLAGAAIVALTFLWSGKEEREIRRRRRGGNARSKGLSELADEHLGTTAGEPLWLAGPAGAELRDVLGSHEAAAALIGTAVWRAAMQSRPLRELLGRDGIEVYPNSGVELFVVPHAEGTRYDLVVLVPGLRAPSRGSPIDLIPDGLRTGWRRAIESTPHSHEGLFSGLPPKLVERAVVEAAGAARFGVVVAPKPEVVMVGCPSPAWPAGAEGADPTSTVGALAIDGAGRSGVTVAYHAVAGHEKVLVNGRLGTVVSSDPISDSCFVEVEIEIEDRLGLRGLRGPLSGVTPRQMEVVSFDGIRSRLSETRVVGWDPTILTMESYIQNKIVTEPVTMPGDSGAALVDSEDNVLGFAFYTTGLNAHPAHSGWIWAASVYNAHGLRSPEK